MALLRSRQFVVNFEIYKKKLSRKFPGELFCFALF